MVSQFWTIVFTALITSAITLGAAWYVFDRYLKSRLNEAIDARAAELAAVLEAHVREGVRQGIREGVVDLPTDVIRKTGRGITETGVGIIEDGLNTILGSPRKRRDK